MKQSKTEPIFGLRGVGPQIAKHLARLNITSPKDLLFHLPARYQNRTEVQTIRELKPNEEALVEGTIVEVVKPRKGKTKLLCVLKDESNGMMQLRFFHVLSFQSASLKPNTRIRCFGHVNYGPHCLEMIHPEFKVVYPEKSIAAASNLTPIYPATEGLSQYTLRQLTTNALNWMKENKFNELLPQELLNKHNFPNFQEAITFIHYPPANVDQLQLMENKTPAQKRLAFEELLTHRISLLNIKQAFQLQKSIILKSAPELVKQFLSSLPFELTNAQKRVIAEIQQDLARDYPMLRLVQGDVGSGKTVVAAMALLQAVANGLQATMMAPTELLAEQHYRVIKRWFEPLNIEVVYLSSNVKGSLRSETLAKINNGKAQIILGTHALFQQEVNFQKLALVIVDEQHRFGVEQRALLRNKGLQQNYYPHQLIMTATPIPRTLAMSFYADLDCSIIDELPPGRTPIVTSLIPSSRRDEVVARIRDACKQGRQVYWVCPLIEESEKLVCQAATQTAAQLQQLLPELKIGLVHGRMNSNEKNEVMNAFQQAKLHLLVATTVIEVGVDVPNASVMIIENAERLGLSQLHQLRGRVGRGNIASHCLLLYQQLSEIGKQRLAVMRETTDGFKIAQRDLELRGPGEVFGTKQTGALAFKVADLVRDNELLPDVQIAAEMIMRDHAHLKDSLIQRWINENKELGKV